MYSTAQKGGAQETHFRARRDPGRLEVIVP